MIYYLKIILLIIFSIKIILKITLIMLLIFGIKYLFEYLRTYIVTIDKMGINFMSFYILNTILFILFYIALLGYLRFLNTARFLDLKILISRVYFFIRDNNFFDTILLFICIILIIIFLYFLITFLKKYYIYHFLKLDIFITYISQYEDFYDRTNYDIFKFKLLNLSSFFHTYFIRKPLDFVSDLYLKRYDAYYNEDTSHRLLSRFTWNILNKLNIPKHEERIPLYLMLVCIIYDILYNNMVLNKFYYISFILFFYYLLQKITDIICILYKGDSIIIYEYLYNEKALDDRLNEQTKKEKISYINKELLKAENCSKTNYPIDYDDNRLIKLSWATYVYVVSAFMIMQSFYFQQVKIYLYQQLINNVIIIVIMLSILAILWYFVNNIIMEVVFLIINGLIILIWLIFLLNHNVPLVFHEILLETPYLKIIVDFTLDEKLLYLKEYFMFKIQDLNLEKQFSLLQILKKIPFYELLQMSTIEDITKYIDNFIITYESLENNIYPLLKEHVQNQLDFEESQTKKNTITSLINILKSIINFKYK